ncbi:hypothetical protein SUDANB180_07515 [Streptomyces sp. enrichment culture]
MWARVRPVVDTAPAAVDVVAVVYVMRGALRHHLLAARRHLSCVLRGQPHQPGLDGQIVQTAVDDYTRPADGMVTADLRASTRAVPRTRPCCARYRTAPPYERAHLAADAARTDWAAVPGRIPSPCLLPRGRVRGRPVSA